MSTKMLLLRASLGVGGRAAPSFSHLRGALTHHTPFISGGRACAPIVAVGTRAAPLAFSRSVRGAHTIRPTAFSKSYPTTFSESGGGHACAAPSFSRAFSGVVGAKEEGGHDFLLNKYDYSPEHHAFRELVRRFVSKEIEPNINKWEEEYTFPRELYKKAGDAGILALGFPEEYGGFLGDPFYKIIFNFELARAGSGGIVAGLLSHTIGAPPIVALASPQLKSQVLPEILSGHKISALAITEPGGGSDVASLRTTARREGEEYVVNGSKMFITSGVRADYLTVGVRTGDATSGAGGISLLLVDGSLPGLARSPLHKMGWHCSDTALIHFDECRVPASRLLGEENHGFAGIMLNFNVERFNLAAMACGMSMTCLEEAIAWTQTRTVFGKPLSTKQVVRHKLVDMKTRAIATTALLEATARRMRDEGPDYPPALVADICMLKNQATSTLEYVADGAVQLLGGMGYMRGTKSERIFRESKVISIGGGASEIMKDLAARQLGL